MTLSLCGGVWQECSLLCLEGAGTKHVEGHPQGTELDARLYIDVNTNGGEQLHHHNVVECGRSAHRRASGGGHQARCTAEFPTHGRGTHRKQGKTV